MVENALIHEKIGFDVIFEFFIYPMWVKKKFVPLTVKIWRQRKNLTFRLNSVNILKFL